LERYEALRERALGSAPDGLRLGLGLLLTRGVAAWMHAARQLQPPPAERDPLARDPGGSLPAERELVSVLAGIALACVEG
jgi:hypothetical protein